MRINITGRNISLAEAQRNYIENKFGNIDYHPEDIIEISVVVEEISQGRFKADATAHSKVGTFFAEVVGNDLRQVIDSLADKIEKQMLRKRSRISEKR